MRTPDMPRRRIRGLHLLAPALLLTGCGMSAPGGQSAGEPFAPPESPTTGNKWVEEPTGSPDGARCFLLVDEECGATGAPDYLKYFESSIFRSGYMVGTVAYAVDGTNLWVLDMSEPRAPKRLGVVSGVGRALAITGYADRLYLAAADQGLIVLRSDPSEPTWLRREHQRLLKGPAMDIALSADGRAAYLATGSGGLSVVRLDDLGAPIEERSISIPGFATGVAATAAHAYVAACSALIAVDLKTGAVASAFPLDSRPGEAPVPAKDVAVEGELAFVAAGRWGTLMLDVSDPRKPVLLGNRTLSDDLLYYANGVTVHRGNLYVAAGDWGVDRLPLSEVRGSTALSAPTKFARYCTAAENPDRAVAPEFQTQLPPPRRQDPLDVVPMGEVLLAMGDASRLGVRAADVYMLEPDGKHLLAGRYEEPLLVRSIAAGGEKVAVAGKVSGLFVPAPSPELLARTASLPEPGVQTRALALSGRGRLAYLDERGTLFAQGESAPQGKSLLPTLAASGDYLVGARAQGTVEVYRFTETATERKGSLPVERLEYGATFALTGERLVVASSTWERALAFELSRPELTAVPLSRALLTKRDLEDPTGWRRGPPRRLLVPFGDQLAEVSSFGDQASGVLHPLEGAGAARAFDVPPGPYVAGAAGFNRLWLVQGDRARYRTTLVEIDFGDFTAPPVTRSQVFLGSAVGAARLGDRLYVADPEVGVRVFALSERGSSYLGVARSEINP